ncbi:ADP-ribosylation factor [Aspergillus heterothallicus]
MQNPQDFYATFGEDSPLRDKFHDIDDELPFRQCMEQIRSIETQNFVLDFGNDDAWCAFNLDRSEISELLRKPRPRCFGTRWIQICSPEKQKESIKAIASYYGVSQRLQTLMCTDPAHRPNPTGSTFASVPQRTSASKGLTFADVTNQMWHYMSVDYGPRFMCIGYNSVSVVPGVDISNGNNLPNGLRLWTWLLHCDDGTVISLQENPYPAPYSSADREIKAVIATVRRNMILIFAGLSKQPWVTHEHDSLAIIRLRPHHQPDEDFSSMKQEDGCSLLFYYLFDDWVSSYAFLAKREHKYGDEYDVLMDRLGKSLLLNPAVELVQRLHGLARKLTVLKRLYSTYETIIVRILQRQRLLRDSGFDRRQVRSVDRSLSDNPDKQSGVLLQHPAVVRFERLLDRIKLCLTDIEICLAEKESLMSLNFNLITLKDSQAVGKLSKVTVLLAKVTILFLPVNLMTAYFSTELQNVKGVYTQAQYWVAFCVILLLSILLLALFDYVSDILQGKTIHQTLLRTLLRTFSRDSNDTKFRGEEA